MPKYLIYYSGRVQLSKVIEADSQYEAEEIIYDDFPIEGAKLEEWWDSQIDMTEEIHDWFDRDYINMTEVLDVNNTNT